MSCTYISLFEKTKNVACIKNVKPKGWLKIKQLNPYSLSLAQTIVLNNTGGRTVL